MRHIIISREEACITNRTRGCGKCSCRLTSRSNRTGAYVRLCLCLDWDGEVRSACEADRVMGGDGGGVERF